MSGLFFRCVPGFFFCSSLASLPLVCWPYSKIHSSGGFSKLICRCPSLSYCATKRKKFHRKILCVIIFFFCGHIHRLFCIPSSSQFSHWCDAYQHVAHTLRIKTTVLIYTIYRNTAYSSASGECSHFIVIHYIFESAIFDGCEEEYQFQYRIIINSHLSRAENSQLGKTVSVAS